jgi:hypothetical protein
MAARLMVGVGWVSTVGWSLGCGRFRVEDCVSAYVSAIVLGEKK